MKMFSVMRVTTHGVIDELEVSAPSRGGYVSLANNRWSSYEVGKDVFDTREKAVAAGKAKLAKRIASLQKSLDRAQKFEVK